MEVQVQIMQESSTYTGIRSAIVFRYLEPGVHMPEVMNASLRLYIKGYHILNLVGKQNMG